MLPGYFMFLFYFSCTKFSIKPEEFILKYLLKKCFLGSKKQIEKYTKRSQKEHHDNTQNLEKYWTCTIRDISYDPYNHAEPNNEKIDNNCSHHDIRAEPLQKI